MFFLFLFAPLSWFQECGSGRDEEHSGRCPHLILDPFNDAEFGKNLGNLSNLLAASADRRLLYRWISTTYVDLTQKTHQNRVGTVWGVGGYLDTSTHENVVSRQSWQRHGRGKNAAACSNERICNAQTLCRQRWLISPKAMTKTPW